MTYPLFPDFLCDQHVCTTRMSVPRFGTTALEITVILEAGAAAPSSRQLGVIDFLKKLPSTIAQDLSTAARRHLRAIDAEIGLANEGIHIDVNNIDQHYAISHITIPTLGNSDTHYAVISLNCDWEEEHGMHILLANQTILYCGSCSTLFYGRGWKRVISAEGEESRMARLNEHLAAVPR